MPSFRPDGFPLSPQKQYLESNAVTDSRLYHIKPRRDLYLTSLIPYCRCRRPPADCLGLRVPPLPPQLHRAQGEIQSAYLEGDALAWQAQQVLPSGFGVFQNCGTLKNLQVHHIQSRSKLGHDRSENLITVCASCHAALHRDSWELPTKEMVGGKIPVALDEAQYEVGVT